MPRIAHLIPYIGRQHGGPVHSLAIITKHQVKNGYKVSIYSVIHPQDGEQLTFDPSVNLVASKKTHGGQFRFSSEIKDMIENNDYDLIHSHGLWTYLAFLAANQSLKHNRPHLLSPCGMLQANALRRRWWKKLPVRFCFQDKALRKATCLQAKSEAEFSDLRKFGLRSPIAIVPNPVSCPPSFSELFADQFRDRFNLFPGAEMSIISRTYSPNKRYFSVTRGVGQTAPVPSGLVIDPCWAK